MTAGGAPRGAKPAATPRRRKVFFAAQRLGLHQVSYMRAIAEGLPAVDAARRYLDLEHAGQVERVHRETVELVRAIARRIGDKRWRLVGLEIPAASAPHPSPVVVVAAPADLPSVEEWAEAEGLADWSMGELLELYQEHFADLLVKPTEPAPGSDKPHERKTARNARLRQKRLELLQYLQRTAVEAATRHDKLDGWFSEEVASKLSSMGALTLGDLEARIRRGGRWWRGLKGVGAAKGETIAAHLRQLLAHSPAPAPTSKHAELSTVRDRASDGALGVAGLNRAPRDAYRVVEADNDIDAIEIWIKARCRSPKGALSYRRELTRFRLWLWSVRQHALSDATVEDCRAYMEFLAEVPESWMSSVHASPGEPGWAPFRTQLSTASQQLALKICSLACAWLKTNGYLKENPWAPINRNLGDPDPEAQEAEDQRRDSVELDRDDPTSRAFTPEAWELLLKQVERDAANPKTAAGAPRMRWLLHFCEATGVRADELLRARRRSFGCVDGMWLLRVYGKGRRRRRVPVPSRVIELTRDYFKSRGLDFDTCSGMVALVGHAGGAGLTEDPSAPVAYVSLSQAFKAFMLRALKGAPVGLSEALRRASLHWLRHTHGTRAGERGFTISDIQTNLGHADPRTATLYARAQMQRRTALAEDAFG